MNMRRFFVAIAFFIALPTAGAFAQKVYKFAHIESQVLIESMPERDSALAKLKAFEQEIMEQMDQLQVEVNRKYQDYLQKRETLTPALREAKEKEITDLQQRVQEHQMAAQRDFQDMQARLMKPIIDAAHAAIEKVGKEHGFLYVFDKSMGSLLYVSPDSTDILSLVQKEMGIQPK